MCVPPSLSLSTFNSLQKKSNLKTKVTNNGNLYMNILVYFEEIYN